MDQKTNNQDAKLWTYYQLDNSEVYQVNYQRHETVRKSALKSISKGSRILEVGFGDGYLLKRLKDQYEMHGADISSDIINNLSSKLQNVQFKEISVDGSLPYPDNYFDGFIASEVLEHMTDDELVKVVEEIHRILKPNGKAILTFPAEENLKGNECFCPNCGEVFHRWGHKQVWNVINIKQRFSIFSSVDIRDFFVRYEGRSLFENVAGWMMYLLRTTINKFHHLGDRSYLVILKK